MSAGHMQRSSRDKFQKLLLILQILRRFKYATQPVSLPSALCQPIDHDRRISSGSLGWFSFKCDSQHSWKGGQGNGAARTRTDGPLCNSCAHLCMPFVRVASRLLRTLARCSTCLQSERIKGAERGHLSSALACTACRDQQPNARLIYARL